MHPGRCVGRCIDFLEEYCGVTIAHECTFMGKSNEDGSYNIHYPREGVPFATYVWEDGTDIPAFTFVGQSKEHFTDMQAMKRERAEQALYHVEMSRDRKSPTMWLFGDLADYIDQKNNNWLCFDALPVGSLFVLVSEAKQEYIVLVKHNQRAGTVLSKQTPGCDVYRSDEPEYRLVSPSKRVVFIDRPAVSMLSNPIHKDGMWWTDPAAKYRRESAD